ncbi:RNA polymerase sigma factor [Dokdonia donghaensis]|uniref:RNA polymerase sigma-70 factor n=1 Tax=Dokdonia donghaensis DSW-1 TaxID=1300343 RepID=A0A0A2GW67_9FLAO|nr:RNA polymerase sigma factor [Dokdonia donghaensis]ANH60221.1 ECF RNA polymerase sigma factor SigW [Dokdonia donghaensis DSW-1]KGO07509.1 RNA polymerase sigma-70 factor [Dokdonia donghaensis DSW-1]
MKVIQFNNERQLIKKAIKGNRDAQRKLYDEHSPKMLSVCRYYIKDVHQAEEAMCNGFLKVFTKLDTYSGNGSFEGWIRKIMVRESISYLRAIKKLYFSEDGVVGNNDAINNIQTDLEVAHIQSLIDDLPEGYRVVFVMYAIEGYKHREIAKALGISESTSKSQLFKARKQLQAAVNKDLINNGTDELRR